jgi:hypothetical protein
MQIIKSCYSVISSTTPTAVVYIGDKAPQNVIQGLLWIDTSNGNFILKAYDGETWQIIQADIYLANIDGGNL